ncbi:AI-2E family transporter [Parasulfuritortus cantonensis]|uniref:AI-2E family transporter n=1 Tax=Parasulfuritortus cantonensis TaxID=2528202 RepID=A0A4R1BIV5_9PROT|nr:AI-2E family transporter [Parasulfuritortus cantonensis]TCJ17098.1 AI-2E family transporter [Parasulfuritortus cantonensis]
MDLNPAGNRSLLYTLLCAGGLYLLYLLSPILTPFLFAAALAYLFDPLVDRLEARRIGRTWGTLLVLLGLTLAVALLVLILTPLFQAQTRMLMTQIPRLVEWGQEGLLPWLQSRLGIDLAGSQTEILDWLKGHAGELTKLTAYLPAVGNQGLALLGWLANLLLIPVVTFYLLRDWDRLVAGTGRLVPSAMRAQVAEVAREVDAVLSEFARGQISVILLMALFYSLALWLAGLDYALAVGMVAGILVFVPYLGVVVGVLLGTLAGLVQGGDLATLLPVWVVFGLGQLLEGMLLTPWLVGDRVGLHPVAVIFALMAFGQLFGFFGVLLAIPASAALLVAFRHLKAHLDPD